MRSHGRQGGGEDWTIQSGCASVSVACDLVPAPGVMGIFEAGSISTWAGEGSFVTSSLSLHFASWASWDSFSVPLFSACKMKISFCFVGLLRIQGDDACQGPGVAQCVCGWGLTQGGLLG